MRCEGVPPLSLSVPTQFMKFVRWVLVNRAMWLLPRQSVLSFGMPRQPRMDCQASRMRLSGTLVWENVSRRADCSAWMPDDPMLPESSTDTMMLGAGSLPSAAGDCARFRGAACVGAHPADAGAGDR